MIILNYPSQLIVFLLIGLFICPVGQAASINANLPELGDESAAVLSPQDERRIGEDFMRMARAQLDIVSDPELNEYLSDLGARLTKGIDGQPRFTFFLVNNSSINAFAVPGGYIGVHTGLLLAARNEAEVAAVLAHETAHITQRHIPRMIAESQRMSGPALAATLAGILMAAAGSPSGMAAVMMAQAGFAQNEINFTRAYEQEADRIGMNILDNAGYDVRAMPAFFEQMELLTRLYENNLPEFLRSHPVTSRRIAESRNHAENFPTRANPSANAFTNMQARLRVLGSQPEETLALFRSEQEGRDSTPKAANQYGLALALLATKHYEEARRETALLLKAHPDYAPYHILRAEIELTAGNKQAALNAYAEASRQFPASLAVVQRHAAALLKSGQPAQARLLLDKAVRQWPTEPALYKLLSTAAGESGNRMEAHRAYGEYYFLTGQPRAAIGQFELAIRFANDNFYYVSSFGARIKDIRDTLPPEPANKKADPGSPSPSKLKIRNY